MRQDRTSQRQAQASLSQTSLSQTRAKQAGPQLSPLQQLARMISGCHSETLAQFKQMQAGHHPEALAQLQQMQSRNAAQARFEFAPLRQPSQPGQATQLASDPPSLVPGMKKRGLREDKLKKKTWNTLRLQQYKAFLKTQINKRLAAGKYTGVDPFFRKYLKARRRLEPNWTPKLAPPNKAGHHAPPLAMANKHGGAFKFGKRGSAGEKARKRLYFKGKTNKMLGEAHGTAHIHEDLAGLNRQGAFKGSDLEFAKRMMMAHHNMQTQSDNQKVKAQALSQKDHEAGKTETYMDIEKATLGVLKDQLAHSATATQQEIDDLKIPDDASVGSDLESLSDLEKDPDF